MSKRSLTATIVCALLVVIVGDCSKETPDVYAPETSAPVGKTNEQQVTKATEPIATPTRIPSETIQPEKTEQDQETAPATTPSLGLVIVIDAGHQAKGNSKREPIGPGAKKQKKMVSSGTRGTTTGLYEYKLNLMVALKLEKLLTRQGYQVVMTRTTNKVNISNRRRAEIANEAHADAFIRIHANGSERSSVSGIMTISNSESNPYNGEIHSQCKKLSDCLLAGMLQTTGAKSRGVWETDTMSGINWSKVPTTIVEMGYMTNPEEDTLLSSDDYQNKIVEGIAAGLSTYFAKSR